MPDERRRPLYWTASPKNNRTYQQKEAPALAWASFFVGICPQSLHFKAEWDIMGWYCRRNRRMESSWNPLF